MGDPGLESLVAADLEGGSREGELRRGVPDLPGRRLEHVGAIIRPQLADRRAPDARLRFVSHRDVTLDEVDRIDRLLTHAGIVHGRATTGNSLQGMDNPFARRYDGTMTISLDSSRFADELRRWRHIRRWSQLELATRAGTTQR
jgi:hypothetical protein